MIYGWQDLWPLFFEYFAEFTGLGVEKPRMQEEQLQRMERAAAVGAAKRTWHVYEQIGVEFLVPSGGLVRKTSELLSLGQLDY